MTVTLNQLIAALAKAQAILGNEDVQIQSYAYSGSNKVDISLYKSDKKVGYVTILSNGTEMNCWVDVAQANIKPDDLKEVVLEASKRFNNL